MEGLSRRDKSGIARAATTHVRLLPQPVKAVSALWSVGLLALGSVIVTGCTPNSPAGTSGPTAALTAADATKGSHTGQGSDPALSTAADGQVIPSAAVDRSNEAELSRQWWVAKAQCHTDNGFPAHFDGEGIETNVGPGQQRDYQEMTARCQSLVEAELGPLPSAVPYAADELRALYHLNVDTNTCLAQHGYPTTEPPTEESFVSTFQQVYAGHEGALDALWTPYPDDPNQAMAAREVCPPAMGPEITEWLKSHGDVG